MFVAWSLSEAAHWFLDLPFVGGITLCALGYAGVILMMNASLALFERRGKA